MRRNRTNLFLGLLLVMIGTWLVVSRQVPAIQNWLDDNFAWPMWTIGAGVLVLFIGLITGAVRLRESRRPGGAPVDLGGLVGRTDGVVPALEADITVGPFEAYGEAEVVIDLEDSSSSYFYMWSELSFWPTEWLRAGLVTQRTRVYQTEREIQRGPLVGVSWKSLEGAVYFFNPGSDDHLTVVSLAVSF